MSRTETNQQYREAVEAASERVGRAANKAADVLRDSSWGTMKGLQDYNEKVLEIAQTNINATFDFFRRVVAAKSPSELITVATEHGRRQFETSNEQAKELAALAQRLALESTEPVKEYATNTFDKAA